MTTPAARLTTATNVQGKLGEAEKLYRLALAIFIQAFGNTHKSTQNSAIGLWNVLQGKAGCQAEMDQLDATHGI